METAVSIGEISSKLRHNHCTTFTILIVEDDKDILSILSEALQREGFLTITARSPIDAMRILDYKKINLMILDLSLGSCDGIDLLKDRLFTNVMPTIIVSARQTDADRIFGLEYGAIDYIVKPFHIKELILRIQIAVTYKYNLVQDTSKNRIIIEDILFVDLHRRHVKNKSNELVSLSYTEYEILTLLVQCPNTEITRDEFYKIIFKRKYTPFDRALDGHVARLRFKIHDGEDGRPQLIKSVRNVGYMLSGRITSID